MINQLRTEPRTDKQDVRKRLQSISNKVDLQLSQIMREINQPPRSAGSATAQRTH